MPKITKIAAQGFNPKRVNIFIDNRFLTSIDRITWIKHNLRTGSEVSSRFCQELKIQNQGNKAYEKALKLLSYRSQSTTEMQQKLARKFEIPIIKKIIIKLKQEQLLNDQQFAINWIKERLQTRLRSVRHLTVELIQKGIDKEIIQKALQQTQAGEHEIEVALILIQKKIKQQTNHSNISEKIKAYLTRRGFPYKIIIEAEKQFIDQCPKANSNELD